jgi:hypothetical protein
MPEPCDLADGLELLFGQMVPRFGRFVQQMVVTGIDPIAQVVALQVGPYSIDLPFDMPFDWAQDKLRTSSGTGQRAK